MLSWCWGEEVPWWDFAEGKRERTWNITWAKYFPIPIQKQVFFKSTSHFHTWEISSFCQNGLTQFMFSNSQNILLPQSCCFPSCSLLCSKYFSFFSCLSFLPHAPRILSIFSYLFRALLYRFSVSKVFFALSSSSRLVRYAKSFLESMSYFFLIISSPHIFMLYLEVLVI